jgi:3-oxoacyl-[acyl-carrier protein] reductase
MNISLAGRQALVGGSTQGLGKAISIELATCGAAVTLVARNEQKLIQVRSELPTPANQKHDYLVLDYADFDRYQAGIAAYFQHRTVDILINNTNGPAGGPILEKAVADYQQAFDLLFKTVCFTTLEALGGMKKNHFGRIVQCSSMTVKEPAANLVLSSSIRSAVNGWSKTLARDLAPWGITVNTILTGYFDTERLNELNRAAAQKQQLSLEEYKSRMASEIPMKRFGSPSEFAHLVAFLVSDYASYITGTDIPIDGGLLRSI